MFRRPINALGYACLVLLCGPSLSAQQGSPGPSIVNEVKVQIAHNDLDSAEKTLWKAISSDPTNPELLMLLGTIRMQQQRYPEAEALLRRVLQLNAGSVAAHRNLGLVLFAQNKSEEAAEQFREAMKSAPKDESLRVEMAKVFVSRGDFQGAAKTLDGIPDSLLPPNAIPVKAAILLGTGHLNEASQLIPRTAVSTPLVVDLAEVFIAANQPDLALRTLAQLSFKAKESAQALYLKGSAQKLKGDISAAKASLNQALASSPKFVPASMALAEIAMAEHKPAEAVRFVERAHAADPTALPPMRRLIELAVAANAKDVIEKTSLELDQRSSLPADRYLSAAALLQVRDFEDAGRIFTTYLEQQPNDSKALLGLGLARLNQQKYPEARKALERALQLDPKLPDAEYSLGLLCNKEGDPKTALVHFERTLQLQPRHAKALLDSGTLYLQAGELDKAKTSLLASEAANANDPNIHYQLSLLYNRLGDTDQARKQMNEFRSLKGIVSHTDASR